MKGARSAKGGILGPMLHKHNCVQALLNLSTIWHSKVRHGRHLTPSVTRYSVAMYKAANRKGSNMANRRHMLALGIIGGTALLGPLRAGLAAENCASAAETEAIGCALLDKYVAAVNAHDTRSFA